LSEQVVAVRPMEPLARTGEQANGGGGGKGANGASGGVLIFVWDGTDARPLAPE
jgi:hypothetical protein